ncbi:outer membrane lipoprotein carrier protein LolA [Tamlana sp. s12]|uniref:LolA family protein n=1 Tax=Tamlana sp. s12 TaxID=1630406 RepID=UPI0007FB748C|nr:outer membrane lipoprotein carrier protein LolA [Tamlana sp. s12]OBQ54696.1 cell envelope biogenesis protein LolA [Tamlana sp. s12]QQY82192.1 outer membrane lipoprotein carrier protein LolA [Tamlana sp. s12]
MRKIIILMFFVVLSAQAQTKMTVAEASDLKMKVKTLANNVQTISSDFVQLKHLDFLDNDIKSSGHLTFKAPDWVKWAYTTPFEYAIIFKESKIFINDEGRKSDIDIGRNKLFKQLNNLIISSVKGDMFDEDKFHMEYFKMEEGSLVYFSPKDEKLAQFIKSFHITFNEHADVTEVKMIEHSNDYTKIIFSNKTLNQPIDEAVFNH